MNKEDIKDHEDYIESFLRELSLEMEFDYERMRIVSGIWLKEHKFPRVYLEIDGIISPECYFTREIKVDLSVNADPLQVERQTKEKMDAFKKKCAEFICWQQGEDYMSRRIKW